MATRTSGSSDRPLSISDVVFVRTLRRDRERGLLGFASAVVNGRLFLDGLAVRRTEDGRIVLTFPERGERSGNRRVLYRPVGDAAREEIEGAVLKQIRDQLPSPERKG